VLTNIGERLERWSFPAQKKSGKAFSKNMTRNVQRAIDKKREKEGTPGGVADNWCQWCLWGRGLTWGKKKRWKNKKVKAEGTKSQKEERVASREKTDWFPDEQEIREDECI